MNSKKVSGRQPPRLRVQGELGQTKTLAPDHVLNRREGSRAWLVLGLGPDPACLTAMLPPGDEVAWIDSPDFLAQVSANFLQELPVNWRRLETLETGWSGNLAISPGALRLFPGFWGPILACLALPQPAAARLSPKTALVPCALHRLIIPELTQALQGLGYTVISPLEGGLAQILKDGRPDLFVSVNFQGLDEYGRNQALLARAGVPTAVWCVDNPFHALNGIKSPYWKHIHLFVTDGWFLPALKAHGARHVHHLPLAASPGFFKAKPDGPPTGADILFVGRSQFPGKRNFFAGLKLPEQLWGQALALMDSGQRPDFAWWAGQLGLEHFWPGKQVRLAGLGAEECGLAWRVKVLTSAAKAGKLSIFGDEPWRNLVPNPFDLHPPVDYYGPLADIYARAHITLAPTSPLLPRGLTQRHFDVWAAGGFLLSDATAGLDIFPQELASQITFHQASDIPTLVEKFKADQGLRDHLIAQWRALMSNSHTYEIRVQKILASLGLDQ